MASPTIGGGTVSLGIPTPFQGFPRENYCRDFPRVSLRDTLGFPCDFPNRRMRISLGFPLLACLYDVVLGPAAAYCAILITWCIGMSHFTPLPPHNPMMIYNPMMIDKHRYTGTL